MPERIWARRGRSSGEVAGALRRCFPAALALFAASAALVGSASGQTGLALYVAYEGDTPSITLASGASVGSPSPPGTAIPAGTYTVQVAVSNGPADFQLVGPGVNFLDQEPSTETYTLTFAPDSTYSYEDVSSPAATVEYFTTGATAASAATPAPDVSSRAESNSDIVGTAVAPSSASAAVRGRLEATVTRQRTARLTDDGHPVSTLPSGRYVVTVEDASRTASFSLEERGAPPLPLSRVGFVGRRSVTLTLTAGSWSYYAVAGHATSFRVTG